MVWGEAVTGYYKGMRVFGWFIFIIVGKIKKPDECWFGFLNYWSAYFLIFFLNAILYTCTMLESSRIQCYVNWTVTPTMRLKLFVYCMHVTNAAVLTAKFTPGSIELNRFRNLGCGLLLDNKDAAWFWNQWKCCGIYCEEKDFVLDESMHGWSQCTRPLYAEITEALVVQGKLTVSHAVIPVQGHFMLNNMYEV